MNELLKQLPNQGIISVVGSGGKTTCLRVLANLLPGRILLCTTTHILPFPEFPLLLTDSGQSCDAILSELHTLFETHPIVCIGQTAPLGKLTAPAVPFEALLKAADYILVEADGSKRLPLKAHRVTEPVIPALSSYTLCVTGLSGMNRPIRQVCHCPELFCERCGASLDDPATPERIAAVLNLEDLADFYLLNQKDTLSDPADSDKLLSLINKPGAALSLNQYL